MFEIQPPGPQPQAVWLSASADLLHDARRDLSDIGALQYDGVRLLDLRTVKASQRNLVQLPGELPERPDGPRKHTAEDLRDGLDMTAENSCYVVVED